MQRQRQRLRPQRQRRSESFLSSQCRCSLDSRPRQYLERGQARCWMMLAPGYRPIRMALGTWVPSFSPFVPCLCSYRTCLCIGRVLYRVFLDKILCTFWTKSSGEEVRESGSGSMMLVSNPIPSANFCLRSFVTRTNEGGDCARVPPRGWPPQHLACCICDIRGPAIGSSQARSEAHVHEGGCCCRLRGCCWANVQEVSFGRRCWDAPRHGGACFRRGEDDENDGDVQRGACQGRREGRGRGECCRALAPGRQTTLHGTR
jgi:hypothetical protein